MSVRLLRTTVSLFTIQNRITGRTPFHTVPTWGPKNGRTCNALLIMSIVKGGKENVQISTRNFNLTQPPTKYILIERFDAVVAPQANSCNNLCLQTQNGQANVNHVHSAWFFTLVCVYVREGNVSLNHQVNLQPTHVIMWVGGNNH